MVTSEMPPPARAGRPKDATKRAAILAAARNLFLSQSYNTVTMEAVAARASVSKMTLYSHFADKETMFETVVREMSQEMLGAAPSPDQANAPLRDRLTSIGISFLTVILDDSMRMLGITLSETLHRDQKLARRFYDAGPGRTRAALAAIIAGAMERGELTSDSPDWAAADLMGLWEGDMPSQLAFGLIEPIPADEIARRARRGTDIFLRAYAGIGSLSEHLR